MLGWKEVWISYDLDSYNRAKQTLDAEGIPYKTKHSGREGVFSMRSPARTSLGRVGNQPEYSTAYRVFVRNRDVDQARYLLKRK